MRGKMINWKKIPLRALYSISYIIVSSLYMLVNRYTGRERELTTAIDNLIPFNRYFILPYFMWYFYVAVFLIYFLIYDEKKYYKLLVGLNAGMLISYLIYIVFPTTVSREYLSLIGNDFIGNMFRWMYQNDNPYNCFPSIHVLETVLILIYVFKDNLYLNKYIKAITLVSAVMIIYSTFAIKQHVVFDAVSATALAYGLYAALDYREIFAKTRNLQRQRISET